jgi:hypothetical protein
MLTLNDNFKEITSHMALLFNEINDLVQQLNDGVEPHELPTITASLREKREKHASLKDELCQLGSVESETAPTGHAHFGTQRDFPDGYRDGQYYLDND